MILEKAIKSTKKQVNNQLIKSFRNLSRVAWNIVNTQRGKQKMAAQQDLAIPPDN